MLKCDVNGKCQCLISLAINNHKQVCLPLKCDDDWQVYVKTGYQDHPVLITRMAWPNCCSELSVVLGELACLIEGKSQAPKWGSEEINV